MNKFKLILFSIKSWISNFLLKRRIIGLWLIEEFIIIDKLGYKKMWADSINGTLLYTSNNFVSVSINGTRGANHVFLFYSGKYTVSGKKLIQHNVYNASDPNRINKTMIRTAICRKRVLQLSANGNYGTAIIKWKKHKKLD